MNDNGIARFVEEVKARLGAVECMTFSGRTESLDALFEAFELGARDCVYVSALTPGYIVKAILARGATPMFCDVTPDSLTIDHRALDAAVRQTMAAEQLYPRAVIADHFCGMPFSVKPVKAVCDRMGLVFIENCGASFGGRADGARCGSAGDYALFSLGSSSLLGTGGSGALVTAYGDSPLEQGISFCDGDAYQGIDPLYGESLLNALERTEEVLSQSRAAADAINDALSGSDFWTQRPANSRQKSSCGALAVVGQSEEHCLRAVEFMGHDGLAPFVSQLHVHRRACFEKGCRGFRDVENAMAIAPRAFRVDLFGALHAGRLEALVDRAARMGREIHE